MSEPISRRDVLAGGITAAAALAFPALLRAADGIPMVVYKDPNCGCCTKWVDLMRAAKFEVSTRDTPDMAAIKSRYKVPRALGSCHTALVGGFVVEGHVPAEDIHRMLKEKPAITGLAVAGMPMGSPGMEGTPRMRTTS